MTRQTMRDAMLMEVTVVQMKYWPIIAQNVYVMKIHSWTLSHDWGWLMEIQTKITIQDVILMEMTLVDQMLTPNGVQIVFVMNKRRIIIRVGSKQVFKVIVIMVQGAINNLLKHVYSQRMHWITKIIFVFVKNRSQG